MVKFYDLGAYIIVGFVLHWLKSPRGMRGESHSRPEDHGSTLLYMYNSTCRIHT